MKYMIQSILLMSTLFFLTACQTTAVPDPSMSARNYAYTLPSDASTSLGRMMQKEKNKHPGKSGFEIIRYGHDAFTARIDMANLAEKTLDLQYYLWGHDETGRQLSHELLKAADKGVKVRILLDDMAFMGHDKILSMMNVHPNIQVRIYNPVADHRKDVMGFVKRVDRRMHNKVFIIDNAFAVVGGRNIGNDYFGVSTERNFRDLDVAMAGPAVDDVSHMYHYYWSGPWSVSVAQLTKKQYTMEDLNKQRAILNTKIQKDHYPYALSKNSKALNKKIKKIMGNFVWAEGKMYWNDPKQLALPADQQTYTIATNLNKRLAAVNKSFLAEAAYFIPGKSGIELLTSMRKKGVRVRVLTNSRKSNDVLSAYAGYNKYRKKLLALNVELYEFRPDNGTRKVIKHSNIDRNVTTGVHSKFMVFDEKDVFVGSFNLDPRSASLNTEDGIYVQSAELSKRVMDFMKGGVAPENAYRLHTDKRGHITWTTEEKGKEVIYTSEPNYNLFEKLEVGFLHMIPLESQL
jgi:putative cardiolipin synthase